MNSFDREAEQEVDFGRYWRLLGARWWVVAAGFVVGAIVGYAISLGGSQTYKASSTLYLGQPYTASGNVQLQGLQTNPSTVSTVAHSEAVDQAVASRCKTKTSSFRGGISSKPIAGSLVKNGQNPLVSLSVQAKKRKVATCAANELADVVLAKVGRFANVKIASFRRQIGSEEKEIKAINAGIQSPGVSSTDKRPRHSVAGLLPSTGRVQSKLVSRRGMKFPWKYAMSPSALAKIVLLDELVCRSITWRNAR